MLLTSTKLFANAGMYVNCPIIADFEVMATDQDFVDCTYISTVISGASDDPSLCIKAFDKGFPGPAKKSCEYDQDNNQCLCIMNSEKDLVN